MLTISNIRKNFGEIVALDGLSLEIRKGEIFGLLGPNGAGKSTLINIAVGLIPPDSGSVRLDGTGPEGFFDARSSLGVAPQSIALYDDLTGEENLRFFGSLYHLSGSRLTDRVDWALEFSGLTERSRDRIQTYSGGMKRRLNLAAALLHEPGLVLLDEPTVGVDPQSRNAIFENIDALHREGRTIIYTTHYMEEAERLCDRVGIIDHGKFLALDTVDGLLKAHGGRTAVIIKTGGEEKQVVTEDPVGEIVRLRNDRRVEKIRIENPDLESVFLHLTGRRLRD